MTLNDFLKEHLIVQIGVHDADYCAALQAVEEISEIIVDAPMELVDIVLENGCYIPYILWWERADAETGSELGMGGPKDPRDPNGYFFSEITHMDKHFQVATTKKEYRAYLETVFSQYPDKELYPGFDIKKK